MRYSQMFVRTLRDAPAGTDTTSAALLIRAGYIRQLGAGIYSFLPLGQRSSRKIQRILREEMEAIGCEELTMPYAQPADLWKETERWSEVGEEMIRFHDRAGRDMVLAPTHEEVATDLIRREVRSYRQLPVAFFQIQTKFRDEPRPRAGLLRGREFLMKDAYSFHADQEDFQRFYDECHRAYLRVFARCGVPTRVVESTGGYMGGSVSHEFMVEAEAGEDTLLICPNGDYSVNREFATSKVDIPQAEPLPAEEVETPGATTIEAVADYVGVGTDQTLKAMFYEAAGKLVFVVIRGDLDVNMTRLGEIVGVEDLKPASTEMIRSAGAVPGYASPVGLTGRSNVTVIADHSAGTPNLVAGANRDGYHLKNVNLGRDYTADEVVDIAAVEAGAPCPQCGAPLFASRGIEVGNLFSLGTKYSGPLRANYLDDSDHEHPMIMGSYGIGVGRLLAAIAEHFADDRGLIWPVSIAPFDVHLVMLGSDDEVREQAEQVYEALTDAGVETLFDDRQESAGVKFNDADLLGMPIRITVSPRSLKAGGIEIKRRDLGPDTAITVSAAEAVPDAVTQIGSMRRALLENAEAEARTLTG